MKEKDMNLQRQMTKTNDYYMNQRENNNNNKPEGSWQKEKKMKLQTHLYYSSLFLQ